MTLTTILLTGFVIYYGPAYDMPAIAARQGVEIPAGYYGIAHWDRDKLGWTGSLTIDGQVFPVIVCDYTHPDDVALVLAFLAGLLVLALPRYSRVDGWLWRWAYGRYLRSGLWRRTARRVLRRDRFTCWRCGQEYPAVSWRQSGLEYIMLEGAPLQVHHLRYRRWYWYAAAPLLGLRENIDDLVTVCRGCHAELHGKED